MIPSPSFTNVQNYVANEFNSFRVRALRDSWIAKLLRKNSSPKSFPENGSINLKNKLFTGIQDIRVDKIIGTFNRTTDFDQKFRPLKKHLRDRWVNAVFRLETDGWSPILVHKVGEFYYVEDGHHRVSVAQFVGMGFISAEVWDHSCCQAPHFTCTSQNQSPRKHMEVVCVNS